MFCQGKSNFAISVILLCFICGCDIGLPTRYQPYTYTGFSSHFKVATGNTNIPEGYKEPPVLDSEDLKSEIMFPHEASEYLKGIKNDLEEIKAKADNATEKAEAVSDMITFGGSYFSPQYVGSVHLYSSQSNFKSLLGYPEFPEFNYIEPTPPITIGRDEFSYSMYKRELADYAATISSYLEDAEHYVRNAQNDYRMVRKKGEDYISYLEALSEKGVDLDITYD